MRRTMFLVTAMAAALVLCSTAAFAAIRIGTDQGEALTGTRKADTINGLGGNDVLLGRAGSDVYLFDDGFVDDGSGVDTLVEQKKRGGGSDLVDFSEVDNSRLEIGLIPEVGDSEARASDPASGSATGKVEFTKSAPERATGGAQDDDIFGGKEKNVLNGGPGADILGDLGGLPAGNRLGFPKLAASNDAFIAGQDGDGAFEDDVVADLAGNDDTLDLTAMGNFEEVDILTNDRSSGTAIDLIFFSSDRSTTVFVLGGVAPDSENFHGQQNGVMEKVIFADGAKSAAEVLAQASAEAQEIGSASSSSSLSSANDQQQQLAERAKKLLEDAQATLPLFGKDGAAGE